MEKQILLAVDIGGSKASFTLMDANANFLVAPETLPVPFDSAGVADAAAIIQLFAPFIRRADNLGGKISAIGVSLCGNVDIPTGDAVLVPNLHWHNLPFSRLLSERYQLPVFSATDVRQALLAELIWGKAKNASYVAWATVGTGYGGYLFLNGRMYGGAHGFAGNFGHATTDEIEGYQCGCGKRGCVETFVAGPAIARAGQKAVDEKRSPILAELAAGNNVTSRMVFEAESRGDPAAREIVDDVVRRLCLSLSAMVNTLDLEMIVMGGGVVQGNPGLVTRINSGIRPYLMTVEAKRDLRIELESFENSALVGAAAHAAVSLGIIPWQGKNES